MRIAIAGGTGFLGQPLVDTLSAAAHEVTILTPGTPRTTAGRAPRFVSWNPDGHVGPWADAVDGADAVFNLAGESIAGRRWSATQKQRILDSRVDATRSLAAAIRAAARPPRVFISASAVGYYGPLADQIVTEEQPAGSDFLAMVCQ